VKVPARLALSHREKFGRIFGENVKDIFRRRRLHSVAMKIRRTVEIMIETRQIAVVRRLGERHQRWCPACAADALMITPAAAARVARVTARTIYRRAEQGQLHFLEPPAGAMLVCLNSLMANGSPGAQTPDHLRGVSK
jgi:hypothetical protein